MRAPDHLRGLCIFGGLAWAVLAAAPALLPAQVSPEDDLTAPRVVGPAGIRLESVLRRFVSYGFSGAVLVALEGQVILLEGYGMADHERGFVNSPATLFEMNSIAKTFTGAAILQLEERGALRTSDSLSRFFGPLPGWKSWATVDHLAAHTAGLVVEGSPMDGSSRAAFVNSVKAAPMESRPGARYRYTNVGYSVLAAVVEEVSGQTYEEYVRRHFFEPAGMTTATFRGMTPLLSPRLARGYVGSAGSPKVSTPSPYVWGTVGAGGVVATVGDIYRWVIAIESGRILSDTARRKLFAPRPPPREGFGWHVHTSPWGTTAIDKGGGSEEFASQVLYFPDDRLIVVWASNDLRQRWRRALNAALPAAALGRDIRLPPPPARARPDLARLAGDYDAPAGAVYFRQGDGFLYARPNGALIPDDVRFLPQTANTYVGYDPESLEIMSIRFSSPSSGPVTAQFHRGKDIIELRKRP